MMCAPSVLTGCPAVPPGGVSSQSPSGATNQPPGGATARSPSSSTTQSPDQMEGGGMLSGLSDPDHRGAFTPTSFRTRPPMRPDRISDPTSSMSTPHSQHVLGSLDSRRAVSDIVGTFNHIEAHRNSYISNPRVSASFKYAEGKVTSILQAFDPLASLCGVDEQSRQSNDTLISSHSDSELSQSMSQSQVTPQSQSSMSSSLVVSPDQGIASPGSEQSQNATAMTTPSPDHRDRDSGVPATPQDGAIMDNLLAGEMSGLKLMEQQNVNIDANRLSAAISLFDPLCLTSESSTDPDPLDESSMKVCPVSEPPCENVIQRPLPISRHSYDESGARPKIPHSGQASNPRISVQSIEPDSNGLSSTPIFDNAPQSKKETTIDLLEDISGGFFDLDNGPVEVNKRHSNCSDVSAHSNESLTKSSTESSCSSLVDLSMNATMNASKTLSVDSSPIRDEKVSVWYYTLSH